MPTLLQICVEGNTGSTGRMAEGLGIFVMRKGWESYIAHGRFRRKSQSHRIRIGSDWEVFLHGLKTRFLDKHGLGSKLATKKLIRRISDIKPDIVHLHHLHGYYINIEILFKFLSEADIPVVWTFHDCWSITGHCSHFDFIGCEKWKTECYNCPQRKEYPASLIIDRSRKNYHLKKLLFTSVKRMTIVPVSNWLNSVVKESFMSKIPVRVIYNGIDINAFTPQADDKEVRKIFNIGKRFMILGVASPWGNRKGLNDFIELSKLLEEDCVIILIGLNFSELKKIPGNIIGLAKTENQQQLKDLYVAADLFMNLSVEETFGLTTAEALACGTPAVVYNATACPEIIDNDTGLVVDKQDFKGLVNAINTVRKNGKEHYSKACRTRAVSLYDKDDRYAEYFDLYNKMI